MFRFFKKWSLVLKVLPFLVVVITLKLVFHILHWEWLTINPLFSSLLAATVFLLGFLISGVLSDYKESEKLPGEIAVSLEAMADEAVIINQVKNSPESIAFLRYIESLVQSVYLWFYKKEQTLELYQKIFQLNQHFVSLEPQTQVSYIVRMKNEQSALRRYITRIHTIRETSFVPAAYAIVEALAFFLAIGLIISKIEPFYEAMFFTLLITFVVTYMIFLIRDMDDPFDYEDKGESKEEISLKPMKDLEIRLQLVLKNLK